MSKETKRLEDIIFRLHANIEQLEKCPVLFGNWLADHVIIGTTSKCAHTYLGENRAEVMIMENLFIKYLNEKI